MYIMHINPHVFSKRSECVGKNKWGREVNKIGGLLVMPAIRCVSDFLLI